MKISDEWSFYNLTLPFDDNCLSLTIYTHDKITNLFKEVNCDTKEEKYYILICEEDIDSLDSIKSFFAQFENEFIYLYEGTEKAKEWIETHISSIDPISNRITDSISISRGYSKFGWNLNKFIFNTFNKTKRK